MADIANQPVYNPTSNPVGPVQQPQPQQPINLPPPSRGKIIRIVAVVVLFLLFGVGAAFYVLNAKGEYPKEAVKEIVQKVNPLHEPTAVPTPIPFWDMTIPYLRSLSYESELGELEAAYEGANYTAYLTSYKSEGLKINGLLTRPIGETPESGWPAVVFIHGYIPPNTYQTNGEAYSSYVDYIASNGFVVFKIDLRGHGNSEGEPGGAYYSHEYVVDALNAYSALENADFVNPKKIGLWGHSMAGNVTMRALAAKPEIPALVIWAGAVYTYEDMLKYRITDASYQPQPNNPQRQLRRQQIYEHYGSPSASVKFWQEVAPVTYLKDLKGAIQIHHASDDDVVNIAYSSDLNKLLDKTSVPNEFYEYQSGGHNISGVSFNEAMLRTVQFYKTYLK